MPLLLIPLLKVFLVTALAGSGAWLLWYWKRGWGNPLGRVLIIDRIIIIALLGLSALSIFAGLNRQTSLAVAWLQIGLIASIGPVMAWLLVVVRRAGRSVRRCPDGHPLPAQARYCPRCGRLAAPAD